jgi:hypothetical protein
MVLREIVCGCVDWLCLDQWQWTIVGDSALYRLGNLLIERLQVALDC